MRGNSRRAVLCASAAVALTVPCLARTTPLTMTVFFFLGVPAYLAGAAFWAAGLLRHIKRHWR